MPRSTLDELRDIWQKKLSSFNVADFPWDPKPTPAPTMSGTSVTASTNGHNARNSTQTPSSSQSALAAAVDGVRIKSEPDAEPSLSLLDSAPSSSSKKQPVVNRAQTSNTPAAQRATALLQNRFGSQANESIGAIQSNALQQQQATKASGKAVGVGAQKSSPPRSAINAAQTDGACDASEEPEGEWAAALARSRVVGDVDGRERHRADNMIRRHVEEAGEMMEGGGLLLPLRPQRRRRDPGNGPSTTRNQPSASLSSLASLHLSSSDPSRRSVIAQADGANDFDSGVMPARIKTEAMDDDGDLVENDEDAINSALDDSDDDVDDNEEDDDANPQVMLCLYDKVQRTKNKWKCTLKDGVLTVGGREYVFQKATGEFEW